jgi:hypothetical protein
LAHNNVYSYVNDRDIRRGLHDVEGRIEFFEKTHPVVFIESGGHGIYGTASRNHSRYDVERDEFTGGTGVTYVYKGTAERPRHANDRKVGYDLLPILTHWWSRATNSQDQRMFDDFGPYEPFGGRPGGKTSRMGRTFLGRKEASNKAKPFWGWHDTKTLKAKALNAGQWGLDPAYAVSRNLQFPSNMAFSLDYTYNPYLGVGGWETPVVITAGTPSVGSPSGPAPASGGGGILPSTVNLQQAREGWQEVHAVVDGSVVFHLAAGEVTAEVLSGQAVRDQKTDASSPIALEPGIRYTVEKRSGRGEVKIVEQPSPGNGGILKVRVDDARSGADRYVFRIQWRRP